MAFTPGTVQYFSMSSTTQTFSVTINSGDFLLICSWGAANTAAPTITWDGVSVPLSQAENPGTGTGQDGLAVYGLFGFAQGTKNLVVTGRQDVLAVIPCSGVKSIRATTAGDLGSQSTASRSITGTVNDYACLWGNKWSGGLTATSPATLLFSYGRSGVAYNLIDASPKTVGLTGTNNETWSYITFNLEPYFAGKIFDVPARLYGWIKKIAGMR